VRSADQERGFLVENAMSWVLRDDRALDRTSSGAMRFVSAQRRPELPKTPW